MESQLRTILYQQLSDRKIAYNPVEPEPFDVVDLTRDVTNSTRIYHKRTECVREALEGASLIITDSQALAYAVALALPRAMVTAMPFGPVRAASLGSGQPPVVGLLNHTGEMEHNNHYALKLLKALKRPLLVYGETLPGLDVETVENFDQFAVACDILLLPSMPGVINSTTLPLSLMAGNTAILAHNAPGYYELSAATGVQLLPNNAKAWRERLEALESQPAKLKAMHERNKAFANRLNRDSYSRLAYFASQFINPPAPLNKDCGCSKKKSAPPNPTKINSF
jgi:glycosyltransferase involved in cell wall biosynthesis